MGRRRLHIVVIPVVVNPGTLRVGGLGYQLVRRGHRITVLGWNQHGDGIRVVRPSWGNYTAYLLPGLNLSLPGVVDRFPLLPSLAQFLKELDFDVLNLHKHGNPSTLPPALLARRMGKPLVLTLHGLECGVNPLVDTAYWAYMYAFESLVLRVASRVVVLNKRDVRLAMRLGCGPGRIRLIPNGVNTEVFRPIRDGDPLLVVWHGRMVLGKGLEDLLMAIYMLRRRRGIPVRLLLVGDGPLRPRLEALARRLGIEDAVEMPGWRSSEQLPELICRGAIYAYPSRVEGMPWAVLEAMSCGRAIVASDIPGIRDVVGHGREGLLVEPGDIHGLAEAMARLIEDGELRAELSRAARAKAVEEHDWSIIAGKVERVYFEAVEEAGS